MIREARIATFLAKAKEAEEQADKATNPEMREKWLVIAQNYRALAKLT